MEHSRQARHSLRSGQKESDEKLHNALEVGTTSIEKAVELPPEQNARRCAALRRPLAGLNGCEMLRGRCAGPRVAWGR